MELREQSQAADIAAQDSTLNEGTMEAPVNTEESTTSITVEEEPCASDQPEADDALAQPAPGHRRASKEEIIDKLAEILLKDAAEISREEVTHLKQSFYAIRKSQLDDERSKFIELGNDSKDFVASPEPLEERLHELINAIKEKKAQYATNLEIEQRANLEKKQAIIDELNKMADDTDNVNRHFTRFRELQQEFKVSGEVPPTDNTEIWRAFKSAEERFYDQLKVNKDLRDYDFKKNLEQKELLIDEAAKLANESDIITAFRRLQELHNKWREIGPVAKELRDSVWDRFKDASAVINKRYQEFFEERKNRERENELAKIALCERIEALDFSNLSGSQAWEKVTKEIIEAQNDWKKLGFASKKVNNALFARFRETCDKFFTAKAEHYKTVRDTFSSNLRKKTELCERAEALKDSTDWKTTADEFVKLQKEWKSVGTVSKKHSEAIWHRFQTACDYFFEQRKKATSGTRNAEIASLKAKKEIIASLKAIDTSAPREEAQKKVKELMAAWQQAGHVPYREKDKINEAYRAAVNSLYDRLDMREAKANMANFKNAVNEMANDENKLYRERERLVRAFETRRSELKTYENNLSFLNIKSKSGNSLVRDMERKMQRLKDDLASLEEKIKMIDSKL